MGKGSWEKRLAHEKLKPKAQGACCGAPSA